MWFRYIPTRKEDAMHAVWTCEERFYRVHCIGFTDATMQAVVGNDGMIELPQNRR